MVKKHGWYYLPGRAPQPIPPDELERLLRVFAQADLNSRQRRRAAADSSFRRAPRVESRSPPRRHRHRSPSSGRDTGRGTHGKTAEDDLMDVSPLTLSPASQRRLDRMWEPSTARIRSVRSAAARPAGYESSESLECLPVGLSWPLSDVSDGQSTSPARPRGAVRPLELTEEPRMDYFWGGTAPATATRGVPSTATSDVAVDAKIPSADVSVEVRPVAKDVAVAVNFETPPRCDAAIDAASAKEVAAWQLPPSIEMRDIADLMVLRPTATWPIYNVLWRTISQEGIARPMVPGLYDWPSRPCVSMSGSWRSTSVNSPPLPT